MIDAYFANDIPISSMDVDEMYARVSFSAVISRAVVVPLDFGVLTRLSRSAPGTYSSLVNPDTMLYNFVIKKK